MTDPAQPVRWPQWLYDEHDLLRTAISDFQNATTPTKCREANTVTYVSARADEMAPAIRRWTEAVSAYQTGFDSVDSFQQFWAF